MLALTSSAAVGIDDGGLYVVEVQAKGPDLVLECHMYRRYSAIFFFSACAEHGFDRISGPGP
jgi:hypothetical protein